jgi:hypothetical protein
MITKGVSVAPAGKAAAGRIARPTAVAIALLGAQAAFGQFTVSRVAGEEERPVGALVDIGSVYPSETIAAKFRLRNGGSAPAAVATLGINGAGFVLTGVPKLPVGLASGEAFDFSVVFQATTVASYSATLEADAVSTLVTAAVLPGLTSSVGAAGVAFGTVEAGGSATRRVTLSNLTGYAMPVPVVTVAGDAFGVSGSPGAGTVVQPGESVGLDVVFRPAGAGTWSGSLTIGDRSYPLSGTAAGLPLPKPMLSLDLPAAKSGIDGTVAVVFDGPARTAGAGTLTLSFDPLVKGATDPAIQLGVVGRSLPFTIAPGDAGIPPVNFRTGTTAGTITLSAELGGATDRKTIVIPAAPVSITSATAVRGVGTIEVRIAGFDNTRTAGKVEYTFYDSAGIPFAPIAVDNTGEFAQYFAGSDAGGAFGLRAVFPVTGDASQIVEVEARMANSAGTSVTGRVRF